MARLRAQTSSRSCRSLGGADTQMEQWPCRGPHQSLEIPQTQHVWPGKVRSLTLAGSLPSARVRMNRSNGFSPVDMWRQLVKAAEPTLFLTLTKAGKTVEEAARALTTFLQYLRRGSRGKGPNRIGAREAYPVEYFAVLERHQDLR